MKRFYSRIPAAAVRAEIDGHTYARIPHNYNHAQNRITEDFDSPRLVRFNSESSFVWAGEAYVYFASRGDALPMPAHLPYGVTCIIQP